MTELVARYGPYPHTRELVDQRIRLDDGAEITTQVTNSMPWRVPGVQSGGATNMLNDIAYDACEAAIVSYVVAREHDKDLVGLPVFITRNFDQVKLVVNKDRIKHPKDLEGRRVGIRYHGFTDGTWARGILSESFGVDLGSITWVTEFPEVVVGAEVPPNVEQRLGESLDDMLVDGSLDGLVLTRPDQYRKAPQLGLLLPDVAQAEQQWFEATGVFPIHHLLVLNGQAVRDHPSFPTELFSAFSTAKRNAIARLEAGEIPEGDDLELARFSGFPTEPFATTSRKFMGADPLRYGFEANRNALEMIMCLAREQGIIAGKLSLQELFLQVDE